MTILVLILFFNRRLLFFTLKGAGWNFLAFIENFESLFALILHGDYHLEIEVLLSEACTELLKWRYSAEELDDAVPSLNSPVLVVEMMEQLICDLLSCLHGNAHIHLKFLIIFQLLCKPHYKSCTVLYSLVRNPSRWDVFWLILLHVIFHICFGMVILDLDVAFCGFFLSGHDHPLLLLLFCNFLLFLKLSLLLNF